MMDSFIQLIFGLVLLGVAASFLVISLADPNITGITGMVLLIPVIGIAIGFGLVRKAINAFK